MMNSVYGYLQLHKEFLLGISEENRPGGITQSEVQLLDLYNWLRKEQGLTSVQALAVMEDFYIKEEAV
ncbi:hypothetical protein [Domibacillus indicus]|uniref:hypothetical protein n=1 Tax=Domibacillus indicus TaxID=1437523 RepID=UPI000617B590|nr:hypothetical protein [Domibacillus indicus]